MTKDEMKSSYLNFVMEVKKMRTLQIKAGKTIGDHTELANRTRSLDLQIDNTIYNLAQEP